MVFEAVATAVGVSAAAWAVRGRSSSAFGPNVWKGPGDRKAVDDDDRVRLGGITIE